MKVFADTSVVLRKLLGEKNSLAEWPKIEQLFASRLLAVEVARVIDRLRLANALDDTGVANAHEDFKNLSASIDVVLVSERILASASAPMPTVMGTLDTVHLVSAMAVRSRVGTDLIFATHDLQLSRGARASGFSVLGVD